MLPAASDLEGEQLENEVRLRSYSLSVFLNTWKPGTNSQDWVLQGSSDILGCKQAGLLFASNGYTELARLLSPAIEQPSLCPAGGGGRKPRNSLLTAFLRLVSLLHIP